MKVISVRLPVVNLLVSSGCGVIGKNWPSSGGPMLETMLRDMCTTTGLHVSRQKENDDGVILAHAHAHKLRGRFYKPVPIGHVIGTMDVLDIFRNEGGDEDRFRLLVRSALQRTTATLPEIDGDRLQGWYKIASESMWSYVVANVRLLPKSFQAQGMVSYFEVPDETMAGAQSYL